MPASDVLSQAGIHIYQPTNRQVQPPATWQPSAQAMSKLQTMNREQRRKAAKNLQRENSSHPQRLIEVPKDHWPTQSPVSCTKVWRSRDFLVQQYNAPPPAIARLSVNRTQIVGVRFQDEITWDELQRIKTECGYGETDAVEIYPSNTHVVNVANMRHLWLLPQDSLPFKWT